MLHELERVSVLLPRFDRRRCGKRCYVSCGGGHGALELRDGRPVMRPQLCVGCHMCVLVCPMHAISEFGRQVERD